MGHPHKDEHSSTMRHKVERIVGDGHKHENPYKKAERICGTTVDSLPPPPINKEP